MTTKETDRVQLNISTAKQENLKEIASSKLFEMFLEAQIGTMANLKKENASLRSVRLARFQAETLYQRVIPRFVQDQHLTVLLQTD